MDIYTALERLENARKSLSIQTAETKRYWEDSMRFTFYGNVMDYYDSETVNFIAEFRRTNEKFESWLYELRQMRNR